MFLHTHTHNHRQRDYWTPSVVYISINEYKETHEQQRSSLMDSVLIPLKGRENEEGKRERERESLIEDKEIWKQ